MAKKAKGIPEHKKAPIGWCVCRHCEKGKS